MQAKNTDEIEAIIKEYTSEIKKIEKGIIEICFFMRGSISWNEAWNLTLENFNAIKNQIKKNIETVNKTGLPII